MRNQTYPKVLIIAGSDPSGGAGIQADIKTCTALGVYAMAAITALTAQNTRGVTGVQAVSSDFLRRQLETILDDIRPDAVKIGMIPNAECCGVIADIIGEYNLENVVTDPVMVATSGDALSTPEAVECMTGRLLPLSGLVTHNIPEAEVLTGMKISGSADMRKCVEDIIMRFGCDGVILKGGHDLTSDRITDYIAVSQCGHIEVSPFIHRKVITENTHGTGCTLSSAIAAHLALGFDAREAASRAIIWLTQALDSGKNFNIGHGHGPVNHLFGIHPII